MSGLIVMILMVVVLAVTSRLRTVEVTMARPLAGCGHCAKCGHAHYGAECPTCGHAVLVL